MVSKDNVFYASNEVFVSSEWAGNGGREVGAWPAVGRHLRWTPELKDRGDTVARWLFGSRASEEPVEFISVHIRHGSSRETSSASRELKLPRRDFADIFSSSFRLLLQATSSTNVHHLPQTLPLSNTAGRRLSTLTPSKLSQLRSFGNQDV